MCEEQNLLCEYFNKTEWSNGVLSEIWKDIKTYCKPYDKDVNYAGRGNSKKFSISEKLVPEFSYNEIFYIHDCMYTLKDKKVLGYSKKFADRLMYRLLKGEGFKLAYIYYLAVRWFG